MRCSIGCERYMGYDLIGRMVYVCHQRGCVLPAVLIVLLFLPTSYLRGPLTVNFIRFLFFRRLQRLAMISFGHFCRFIGAFQQMNWYGTNDFNYSRDEHRCGSNIPMFWDDSYFTRSFRL